MMRIRTGAKPLIRVLGQLGGVLPDNVQGAFLGAAILVRHHERPGSQKAGTYSNALLTRDGLDALIAQTREKLPALPEEARGKHRRTVQELEWARDTLLPWVEPLPPLLAGVSRSQVAVRKLLLLQDPERPVYVLLQMAERALVEQRRVLRPRRASL